MADVLVEAGEDGGEFRRQAGAGEQRGDLSAPQALGTGRRRHPQPRVTSAITDAVFDELAEQGMVVAVLSEFGVPRADVPDTGSLRGDLPAILRLVHDWLTRPRSATVLPDVTAEAVRSPALAAAPVH
ncbi:TetR-like C-terminal domain-containing protein [Saccharothrix syringae]|uniref:TetR-like C-terminal domain-containing protein n=1 Tax=Saccharothrix syringae TaxID=103733 RepID=UPI0005244B7A|nr:TetR-like C-terminal domain-containing protein [Saccharothrix syringae]